MLRLTGFLPFLVIISMTHSCTSQSNAALTKDIGMDSRTVEGAYEFVSETVMITSPNKGTEKRTSDEWTGLWFFQHGRFSETLMKKKRSWPPFPTNEQDLGYESSAGTYDYNNDTLVLRHELSLNPFSGGRNSVFDCRIEGETLTLTETKMPYMESLTEGKRILILRKLQ